MPIEVPSEQPNTNVSAPQNKGVGEKKVVTTLIVVLVILIVLTAVWLALRAFSTSSSSSQPETVPVTNTGQKSGVTVNDVNDLEKLEKEVKATDIDTLTEELDKNDEDAAGF